MKTVTLLSGLFCIIFGIASGDVFELESQSLGAGVTMTNGPVEMTLCEAVSVAGRSYGGPFSIEAAGSMLIRDTSFFIVSVSIDGSGSVRPNGIVEVNAGESLHLDVMADAYYHSAGVKVGSTNLPAADEHHYVFTMSSIMSNATVVAFFSPDLTTNGVPHWWLVQHVGPGEDWEALENSDVDGDGMAARKEWICGTRPNDAGSVLCIRRPEVRGDQIELKWQSVSGKKYAIYGMTDLATGNALPLADNITASSAETSLLVDRPANRQYFYFIGVHD